jgi:hypothetical protein
MKLTKVPALLVLLLALSAIPVLAATHYFQGFETDTNDWSGVTRVATGFNGVNSAAGNYHAEADSTADPNNTTGDFTRFGGYENTFPAGGYTTSMDVYLDVNAGYVNDTRFDWSSAISDPTGGFHRDFVFNAGFYNDSDQTGSGPRFVISASNNATRSGAYPKNPERKPIAITTSGWYSFQHHFYNKGGVLAVDLSISTLDGTVQGVWNLSDPTDVIGTTVGGHRYGWLVIQEFPFLAIDNVSLLSVNQAASVSACKNSGWQGLTRADGTSFTNQGDCIQYVNTGK